MDEDIPGIAMSRSLGDAVAGSVGVVCDPEIIEMQLLAQDKFIIIGSDGIFEFIGNDEAVRIVLPYWKQGNVKGACDALAQEAHNRWVKEEEVIDDITCVIIFLSIN